MSDATQPAPAPSVSWRRRVARRTAGAVGAAVVLAGVAPAIANAAGAEVGNPVAFALRASGHGLASAFSADAEETAAPCVTPSGEPGAEVSAAPSGEPSADVSAEPVVEPTADPSALPSAEPDASASADPDAPVGGDPSGEPASTEPSAEPSAEPAAEPADDCAESATPVVSAEPSEEAAEPEPAEDGEHGEIVSTVAKCAPKGKDPLLDAEGAPANHGGYVKAAAHGDTLTTPWGSFDLGTQAGADALCASLAAARDALPEQTAAAKEHGKKAKADHGRPAKAKKDKAGGKPGGHKP